MSFLDEPRRAAAAPPAAPPPGPRRGPPDAAGPARDRGRGRACSSCCSSSSGSAAAWRRRRSRAFKDYVSDADELVASPSSRASRSSSCSRDPGNSEVDFQKRERLQGRRRSSSSTARTSIDVPDELNGAHDSLVETLELRRDGLDGIAPKRRTAARRRGTPTRRDPNERSRADAVLPRRATSSTRSVPPEPARRIEERGPRRGRAGPATLTDRDDASCPTSTGCARPCRRTAERDRHRQRGDTEARPPRAARQRARQRHRAARRHRARRGRRRDIPAGADVAFDIEIANQGENAEEDVVVVVEIAGAGKPIALEETLDAINPGESKIVTSRSRRRRRPASRSTITVRSSRSRARRRPTTTRPRTRRSSPLNTGSFSRR